MCEIEKDIKITMFSIYLQQIDEDPLLHMKFVAMTYRNMYSDHQNKLVQEKDKINEEIAEIKALCKQIEEQTQTEVLHMKKGFLDVINQCKKQLRKEMKPAMNQIVEEEEDETKQNRIIRKVDMKALEEQRQRPTRMNMEEPAEERDFDSIFNDN